MHRAKFGSDFSWLKEHILKIFDFAILCTVFFSTLGDFCNLNLAVSFHCYFQLIPIIGLFGFTPFTMARDCSD